MLEMDLGYEGTNICVVLSPYILQVAVKHISHPSTMHPQTEAMDSKL